MINDYGQDTYKVLSKLLKLTFTKYLKDSGIKFNGIYQLKNLTNGVEFYMIEVNNIQIRFKTSKDFLLHFMTFLKKNIAECNIEYQRLTTRAIDEFTDEIGLEMRYKEIDYYIYQQSELLKFIKIHYEKVKAANVQDKNNII